MMKRQLRIATRKSPLAMWQAEHIKARLEKLDSTLAIELLPIVTQGDKLLHTSLIKFGGKGLFVKELEKAMLNGDADLAVHSMKDVPVHFPKGLQLAAICERESPFDAFVSNHYDSIEDLPENAIVGTSSMRRHCQLKALKPSLMIKNCRGNVNTRLKKLDDGEYDAIILAEAGLNRLNFSHRIKQVLTPNQMLPACGQGALGLECRSDDDQLLALINQLASPITSECVKAERLVNDQLGGNCQVPIAAFCESTPDDNYELTACVGNCKDFTLIKASACGNDSEQVALSVSQLLIDQGALHFIELANNEQTLD